MRITRVIALAERFLRISFKVKWRAIEIFYYPVITLLMWGFLSWASRGETQKFAFLMLGVQVIWSYAFAAQSNFNIFMLEDIWHNCLKEVIVSPITTAEYLTAKFLAAFVRSVLTFISLVITLSVVFRFYAIFADPIIFLGLMLATLLASTGIGLLIDALIIQTGREFGFLSWSGIMLFIMISCPYYSIDAFPQVLHPLVKSMPYYWIFHSLKGYLTSLVNYQSQFLVNALVTSVLYLLASIVPYVWVLRNARETGKFITM